MKELAPPHYNGLLRLYSAADCKAHSATVSGRKVPSIGRVSLAEVGVNRQFAGRSVDLIAARHLEKVYLRTKGCESLEKLSVIAFQFQVMWPEWINYLNICFFILFTLSFGK